MMHNIVKGMLAIVGALAVMVILQYFTGTLDSNIANFVKGLIVGMISAHYSG